MPMTVQGDGKTGFQKCEPVFLRRPDQSVFMFARFRENVKI
jgi:hypothetical protein